MLSHSMCCRQVNVLHMRIVCRTLPKRTACCCYSFDTGQLHHA
jgi:hypothetical protein